MVQDSTTDQMIKHLLEENKKLTSLLEKQQHKIDELLSQVAWFQRIMFGRKSEKLHIPDGSPGLFDEEFGGKPLEEIEAKRQEAEEEILTQAKPQKKRGAPRKDIMKDLPVVEEVIEPEQIDLTKYKR